MKTKDLQDKSNTEKLGPALLKKAASLGALGFLLALIGTTLPVSTPLFTGVSTDMMPITQPVLADHDPDHTGNDFPEYTPPEDPEGLTDCGGIGLSIDVGCVEGTDNPILAYLGGIINFLAAGVGLVVTAMVIVGGIQYITAGGVPQKLEAARRKITNALIAFVTFLFLYAIIQWLIPGGLLGGGNPPPAGEENCAPQIGEECLE